MSEGREPMRVLILGSCVSRDILNYASDNSINLVDYFARSSIASILAKPFGLDESFIARIPSQFQQRMVRRDVNKEFLPAIADRQDVDIILLDLIDERFDLYEACDGSVATMSSEFSTTGFAKTEDRSTERWLRSGSERHRELWKAAVGKLFEVLSKNGVAERVVVNKVFWAEEMEDGTPLPQREAGQRKAANELLAWMYRELERYVPAPRWMTFPENLMKSKPDHRWGLAPFHYTDAYYENAIVQLKSLYEKRRHDGGCMSGDHTLYAWAGLSRHDTVRRFYFLVFRDKTLIHTQPYSAKAEMIFDTQGIAGEYEVAVLVLVCEPGKQQTPVTRRYRTMLQLGIMETSTTEA
jgi:hypothetical protein